MAFADTIASHLDGPLLSSGLRDAITYAPRVGSPVTVAGFFDAAFVLAEVGGAGVQNVMPAAFVRVADLPVDPEDDDAVVTVNGKTYRVTGIRPDGTGVAVLLLREEP